MAGGTHPAADLGLLADCAEVLLSDHTKARYKVAFLKEPQEFCLAGSSPTEVT